MTGEKNRGVSLEKLWNLDDKQLTTPKHDELVLQITPQYILKTFPLLIEDFLIDPLRWSWGYRRDSCSDFEIATTSAENINKDPKYRNVYYAISNDGSFERVSIYNSNDDVLISDFRAAVETEKIKEKERCKKIKLYYDIFSDKIKNIDFFNHAGIVTVSHEVPIVQSYNKYIIGYWDCVVGFGSDYNMDIELDPAHKVSTCFRNWGMPTFYIEAKPYIDSYGAVIRQMKTYINYLNDSNAVVCILTPDNTFDSAFESQGITMMRP